MAARRVRREPEPGFFERYGFTKVPDAEELSVVKVVAKALELEFTAGRKRRIKLYQDIANQLRQMPTGKLGRTIRFPFLSGVTKELVAKTTEEVNNLNTMEIPLLYEFWRAVTNLQQFAKNPKAARNKKQLKRILQSQAEKAKEELNKTWLQSLYQYYNYYSREAEYLWYYNTLVPEFYKIGHQAASVRFYGEIEIMKRYKKSFSAGPPEEPIILEEPEEQEEEQVEAASEEEEEEEAASEEEEQVEASSAEEEYYY